MLWLRQYKSTSWLYYFIYFFFQYFILRWFAIFICPCVILFFQGLLFFWSLRFGWFSFNVNNFDFLIWSMIILFISLMIWFNWFLTLLSAVINKLHFFFLIFVILVLIFLLFYQLFLCIWALRHFSCEQSNFTLFSW